MFLIVVLQFLAIKMCWGSGRNEIILQDLLATRSSQLCPQEKLPLVESREGLEGLVTAGVLGCLGYAQSCVHRNSQQQSLACSVLGWVRFLSALGGGESHCHHPMLCAQDSNSCATGMARMDGSIPKSALNHPQIPQRIPIL